MKILSCLLCAGEGRRDTKTRYIIQLFFKEQSKVVAAIIETEDDDGDRNDHENERRAISVQKLFLNSCRRGPLLYEYILLSKKNSFLLITFF